MLEKTYNHMETFLSFHFANSTGEKEPLIFREPIRVIATNTIEEIENCFVQIQEEVKKGYYAAGFLSYESAPAFDPAFKVQQSSDFPLLWFGIFSEPEHFSISSTGNYSLTEWIPSVSKDTYQKTIHLIKQAIEEGNTYQTNYTIRLKSQFEGDDVAFFETLLRAQSSNYSAYLHTGDHSILSASPELFFRLNGDMITTRPMKGTIKRGLTFDEDETNSNWLYHSEKNRAENVMIVDLLRNDLGMIAQPGTVRVPEIFEIEKYPTVHQMTSTITGKLRPRTNLYEIFKALFPCGSITGAPKISTMELISEIEPIPRDVYCGAIGYITPNQEAIFNVPIRTVIIDKKTGEATYGVGGGVTWDSTSEDEYEEIITKAKLLKEGRLEFQLLESLLLENGEYFLLTDHLKRLQNTATYFQYPIDVKKIQNLLAKFASINNEGIYKVRLLVSQNGDYDIENSLIERSQQHQKVILAKSPMSKNNPFLYHKTTNREVYTIFQKDKPVHIFDILLWNEEGEITEFTNGNIVVEQEGKLYTPPIKSGLLAGTFRGMLIQEGKIVEKILNKADLRTSSKIWFINSVRKWVEVEIID